MGRVTVGASVFDQLAERAMEDVTDSIRRRSFRTVVRRYLDESGELPGAVWIHAAPIIIDQRHRGTFACGDELPEGAVGVEVKSQLTVAQFEALEAADRLLPGTESL